VSRSASRLLPSPLRNPPSEFVTYAGLVDDQARCYATRNAMRILQLTSHLEIGGIPRYVVSLTEQLIRRSHQVTVASDGGAFAARVQAAGGAHWAMPLHTSAEWSLPVLRAYWDLLQRMRREPMDVLHAHTRVGQVLAHALSHRLRVPYVTTWHGIYRPRWGRRLWPCTGALTIAISRYVAEDLRRTFHVPPARVRLIHNGIDTAHYALRPDPAAVQTWRARWQLPPEAPIIGNIGRLASGGVKGFDMLLEAASHVKDRAPNLQVLIVGDGPRRPFLEEMARRLQLTPRVHFVGAVEDIRIPLALMDVFVFTSRRPEAFGLTLVEAMAAGNAVIATNHGAVQEILRDDVDGLIVPPEDPPALADGIARLLRDRATASRLGRAAQARAQDAFDLRRMVDDIEAVYREVVPSGG